MSRTAILLLLLAGFACGQLNFEGNPLTEDTEYMAEESKYSQRSIHHDDPENFAEDQNAGPQKLYPVFRSVENTSHSTENSMEDQRNGANDETSKVTKVAKATNPTKKDTKDTDSTDLSNSENSESSARHIQSAYTQKIQAVIDPAEVALNTFLNSKTPEESRLSLDSYLRSSQVQTTTSPKTPGILPQDSSATLTQARVKVAVNEQTQAQPATISRVDQKQQVFQTVPQVSRAQQQQLQLIDQHQQVNQRLNQRLNQQVKPQLNQQLNQQLIRSGQGYGYVNLMNAALVNPQHVQPNPAVPGTPVVVAGQQIVQPSPYASASIVPIQPRNDIMVHPAWRYRMRGVRARPYPFAQPRLGPGVYKAPVAVPFKQKEPVEIIYTRPPGFHRGPPRISNPPVPYEDASAWFPESDHPPPTKDVYYSQLYAQSYDPHYYNYIAKTGKIKPHLYGKLGKYHEEKDDGIWSELYRGFKKHGLKNIMTPSFLLGMTIPAAITLMLSMLVQKRSLARADSRSVQQDLLQEYTERVQRAIECFERKRRKNGNSTRDDCY